MVINTRIKYIPIIIDSLNKNYKLGFNLYYRNNETKKYVLYKNNLSQLTEKQIQTIKNNFKVLFIELKEKKSYAEYVEKNLDLFMDKKNVKESVKAFVLYEVSEEILKDTFTKPDNPENIKRSEKILKITSNKIFKEKSFFKNLVSIMTFGKDVYKHSVNVSNLTINFLKKLNIDDMNLINDIILGAFLHDIGKIKIPDEILYKKDKLTDEEFEIMKQHVTLGYKMLENKFNDRSIIYEIVLHHHEKLNGTGYPKKISNEEIPWYVQVVSISDVFEALTAKRSYKKSKTIYETLEIMRTEADTGHFDRKLLNTFIKMMGLLENQ